MVARINVIQFVTSVVSHQRAPTAFNIAAEASVPQPHISEIDPEHAFLAEIAHLPLEERQRRIRQHEQRKERNVRRGIADIELR